MRGYAGGLMAAAMVASIQAGGSIGARAEEPVEVREVVISATKTPLPAEQVTSAVEIITGEEMEQRRVRTVVDMLRLAQGLAVFSNGGPGTIASVRMRGAAAHHTLVMIDGAIMNSPTDGAFNFANLTPENIDRIEILRGAQSMLYGSDAIGGVINIITKRGAGSPTANAFVEYGSFTSLREGVQASGAKGPVDFTMSVTRWDTASFSAVNYRRGAFERDGFHNWQASSKVGVALPRDGRLEFSMRWMDSIVNLDSAFGNSAFDVYGAKQTMNTLTLTGSYEQPITDWWNQRITVGQTNERLIFDGGTFQRNVMTGEFSPAFSSRGDIEILNRRLEWQHNVQVAKPLLLSAGYQFREEQGDNVEAFGGASPTRIISSHAVYGHAQVNYEDRLFLTAGARHDDYNVFGDVTTYRTTAGYLLPETGTKLRTSYATGFRAPTLNQLFWTSPFFSGNPHLKPEKSTSVDAGVDQRLFNNRVLLSAGYFWNRFEDLITTTFTTFEQVSRAESKGWELGFQYEVMKGLAAHGQYTYTMTRDLETARRLSRWPVHQGTVGVTVQPIEPVHVIVDYRYVGSRYNNTTPTVMHLQRQKPFGVVNVAASYDVNPHMQVFGRIENLFNEQYEEILFFGTPIRSVYGGIRWIL